MLSYFETLIWGFGMYVLTTVLWLLTLTILYHDARIGFDTLTTRI
jgi:hypothetical protein